MNQDSMQSVSAGISSGVSPQDARDPVRAAEEFMHILKARGYSASTIRLRRWFLREFVLYSQKKGVSDLSQINADFLNGYITHLSDSQTAHWKRARYAPGAVESAAATLRVFFRHLAKRGVLLYDPSRGIDKISYTRTPPVPMTPLQAERALSFADTQSPDGLRDRAILELLYGTGIRRAEAVSLRLSDVRMESGTVFIFRGKGGRDRVIPLGERAKKWVRHYLELSRPALLAGALRRGDEAHKDLLFVMKGGGKIRPERLTKITAKYMRLSGMEHGSCHIFRHTCATEMLSGGADIIHIQELLGHERVTTSQEYLHITPARLREKYARSHPSSFSVPDENPSSQERPRSHTRIQTNRVLMQKQVSEPDAPEDQTGEIERTTCDYLESRRAGMAQDTQRTFRGYLRRFSVWCFALGVTEVSGITSSLLEQYQSHLSQRRKSGGDVISLKTQKYEMEAVCTFVRWCHGRALLLCDPTASIELPRTGKSLACDFLSREETERVLSLPDTGTLHGLRDRAVMEILYASGIRASELCVLRMSDPDFERDSLRITASKNGRDRVIPVSGRAMKWLDRYVRSVRPEFEQEPSDSLFLADTGRGLSTSGQWVLCSKYLRSAGIKRGSVHIFRHSCATHMIENGADLRTVQEYLGHRSIESTKMYAHITIKNLKEVHAMTHPAEKRYLDRLLMEQKSGEDAADESKKTDEEETDESQETCKADSGDDESRKIIEEYKSCKINENNTESGEEEI